MNIPRKVAHIIPPRTVQPIVLRATAPAPEEKIRGDTPKMKAIEVIIIGRKRSLTASIVDSIISLPESTLLFANSTIKIEFLADRPISVTNPIWE